MIETILIINKQGVLRLIKVFTEDESKLDIEDLTKRVYESINTSKDTSIVYDFDYLESKRRLLFRAYGSIYIAYITDELENELGILDFINLMMKVLDDIFKGVTEKDIITNPEKIYLLLDEMVSGGIVIETDKTEILVNFNDKFKD
jgi:AP-3 complex subunit sigma